MVQPKRENLKYKMAYKLFLPSGATESGNNVILASGLTLPRYAFIAVPIVGLKGVSAPDLLTSSSSQSNVYYDTTTNSFTTNKKIRNINQTTTGKKLDSLSSSEADAFVKFNFDGYINISTLISNIKSTISSIKETQTNLTAFEQDIGYNSVRTPNLINYSIITIDPTDNYQSIDYPLSENLTLRDLLVYQLKPSTLTNQLGLSTKIIVKNLKNLAVNVYEPVLKYLLSEVKSNIQIYTAFTETVYYVPDQEFYLGEAIQFTFPGSSSASIYLLANQMLNSLYFTELYLDYFENSDPRITITITDSAQNFNFGTRFEYNLIHPNRLVNIDKNFNEDAQNSTVFTDGTLNNTITFQKIDEVYDKVSLQTFIKEAIKLSYIQSQEIAITSAFTANLDISDLSNSTFPLEQYQTQPPYASATLGVAPVSYYEGNDYSVDYDAPSPASNAYNSILATTLTSLIKCPMVDNGSVNGYPDQSIFPMMSNVGYRTLTDLTMLNNPSKNPGEYGIARSVRFNNPFLVDVVDGVTNLVKDGYIGQVEGKAVYSNRLGGLIAGLRQMQSKNLSGNTIFSTASSMVPSGLMAKAVASLSQAFFGLIDPTGMMLSCSQFDYNNGNMNNQIVTIAMMLAAFTGEKKSPFTYEELSIALQHAKGQTTQFNKSVDGTDINTTRDPSKELHISTSKIENTANSTPMDFANTIINGVKALILDGNGQDIQTKNQRLADATTTFNPYDIGSDHLDRLDQIGSYTTAGTANTKSEIF